VRDEVGLDVGLSDWNALAGLPLHRTHSDVQALFYPNQRIEDDGDIPAGRRPGFFSTVEDAAYEKLRQFVALAPDCAFVDVHSIVKTCKQGGKIMSIVMTHVGQWMNYEPEQVPERSNNKPPLRNDFLPSLQEKYGQGAERQSIVLQERILNYVRKNTKDLTSPALKHFLHEYPSSENYAERFEHSSWKDILVLVLNFAGPRLRHPSVVRFNTDDLQAIQPKPAAAIAQGLSKMYSLIPELAKNPALQQKSATDDLSAVLQPVVAQWAAKHCLQALQDPQGNWDTSTKAHIKAELVRYNALLERMCISTPLTFTDLTPGTRNEVPSQTSGPSRLPQGDVYVQRNEDSALAIPDDVPRPDASRPLQSSQCLIDRTQLSPDNVQLLRKTHCKQQRASKQGCNSRPSASAKISSKHWRQRPATMAKSFVSID
jgi:hypothetical protein